MPRKVKLIFNPIANLGRAWPVAAALRPLVYELGGADWSGTVYPTHATELARQAAEEGYELVVAMGGDGTVHEVANGLMQVPAEQRPRLGIVPVGSGNDFASSLGISAKPEEALRQVMTGTPHPMDVGLISDGSGRQEYWTNAVGIGFDTVVTIRSRRVPIVQGFGVYFVAVLQTILLNHDPFHLTVKTDREQFDEELLMLVLCNGGREGGGFYVAPKASPLDGVLNYVGVHKISRLRMLATIPAFLNGSHERFSYIHTGNFHSLELQANRPLYVHTDGEIFAGFGSKVQKLQIQIYPGALQAVC
jgi:diacylglycerol kinase (ATP)